MFITNFNYADMSHKYQLNLLRLKLRLKAKCLCFKQRHFVKKELIQINLDFYQSNLEYFFIQLFLEPYEMKISCTILRGGE
jgi:hypothetical protein